MWLPLTVCQSERERREGGRKGGNRGEEGLDGV